MGQNSALESMSMAQDGHSFVFGFGTISFLNGFMKEVKLSEL
jgi:hypothetical protein